MVNTTDIKTFLGKCHATATVKTYTESRNINFVDDASGERMLVYPPELISIDNNHYTERYMIKLSETTEATLTAMLNDIIDNIIKLNRRETISGYTKPTTLCNIELKHSNKAFENGITKRWDRDIYIDVEWSTS